MSEQKDFLDKVYSATTVSEIQAAYDEWAVAYDEENLSKGFRLPGVGAAYFARHVPHDWTPILDAGCGTGLVGETLSLLGYRNITGLDLSQHMLEVARKRGVYDKLEVQDLCLPLPAPDNHYAAAICLGSFGPGHAPPDCLDELVRVVRLGGVVVFNIIDETHIEQGFASRMTQLEKDGLWHEIDCSAAFQTYLLRASEMNSRIFVYRVST